jgi:hypothetical protein
MMETKEKLADYITELQFALDDYEENPVDCQARDTVVNWGKKTIDFLDQNDLPTTFLPRRLWNIIDRIKKSEI